jgi:copper ion binding protein
MTKQLTVNDMTCGHCVQSVTQAVSSVPGVQNVQIDLATKRVNVEASEQVSTATLVQAINEAGYTEVQVLN